ncbi:SycD/LcrH family type III secretion system chaperone CesD [Microvirgula curvata]
MNTENGTGDVLRHFLQRGGSIRMLQDIEQADLDRIYAYATQLFEAEAFESARNFYYLLARIDHWNFDYWLALGLSYQRLQQNEEALFSFCRAGMIRVEDPRPAFFAGLCYQVLGNVAYARKAFHAALRWCGSHADHEPVRRAAVASLSALED